MKIKHLCIAAALSAAALTGVNAQQPESLQAQIESLNARIASLETDLAESRGKADGGAKSFFDEHLRISGYVQVGYEWTEDTASTFFLKRARFKVDGDLWRDKLDYCLQIEFASPKVVDAYVRFKPMAQVNAQLGQFKIPFSIENTEYAPLRAEFIEYPLALRKLVRMDDVCGISSTGRDIGAQIYGSFFEQEGYHILNYSVAVMNGSGINKLDDNKSKDLIGRVMHGAYVTAGYKFDAPFVALARWEFFDENKAVHGYRQTNYAVGVDYRPLKYLRMQLNYTYAVYSDESRHNISGINFMLSGIF